jgi:DNA-binding SARP family transcriptional activator
MAGQSERIVRLFLPLLAHPDEVVRRQAGLVLLCSYGAKAREYVQPLLRDSDMSVRDQVRSALETLSQLDEQAATESSPGELYVQCLGKFQVKINDQTLALDNWESSSARAGWQKVRRLFAYLVHCGRRGASRRSVMEAVWSGDLGPSNLSRTLVALQQTLAYVAGDALARKLLVITDDHCALDSDLFHTDVEQFQHTYDLAVRHEETQGLQAAAPLYAQAIDLYGGPYLADIGRASWAQERRDLLASHFINGCERLAEHAFAHGRYRECLELCRQALDVDIASDEVTVWLLRAYAALGRSAELERAYATYLRTAHLAPLGAEVNDDPVVAAYKLLSAAA